MTTETDENRATINMLHGNVELKISEDEAHRANEATTRRLLAHRKLSLVVDLDQTIIHAVCDPTVGDWQKDESNPNHDAVKDVQSFELIEDVFNNRPCSYYIKIRPGLREFLEQMAGLFELHIYTMGTRSYAENVAKIVDPMGKIFGDRILSRDESGSMTAKSLHRLFPVDTKMVVIIDDRGDVWNWSPNLIRVRAFNFYVGIGDINSSFLPKRVDIVSPSTKSVLAAPAEAKEEKLEEAAGDDTTPQESTTSIEEQLILMAGSNDPALLSEQSHKQQEEIAAQVQERPLLKKQELLDSSEIDANKENAPDNTGSSTESVSSEHHRIPLLRNEDIELRFLQEILERVHTNFFSIYDRQLASIAAGGRVAQLKGERKKKPIDDLNSVPDIKELMPLMKNEVLAGVVICFTGLIPQGMIHERYVSYLENFRQVLY
jgi:RNA polymerase II subunit A C-terminal domain phosphatase